MSIEQLAASDNGEESFCGQVQVDSLLKTLALQLAEDPENEQLLSLLVEEASKSALFSKLFEYQYNLLKTNGLANSPIILVAILGQQYLGSNLVGDAIELLESALKLAPENKQLRASICSSLANAHFSALNLEKALKFMNEDLRLENELCDINGQCRALRNLAHLHFKMGKFEQSINTHRRLIDLAMREKLFKHVCYTLSALGHVHAESLNLNAALTSHDRSLVLMRELGEPPFEQFKELMSIGHIYSLLDDFKASQEKYEEAEEMVALSEQQQNNCGDKLSSPRSNQMSKEQIFHAKVMLHFNRALIALKTSSYLEARKFYEQILMLANKSNNKRSNGLLNDQSRFKLEMRAYLGLAHTCRLEKNAEESRTWMEKHLNLAHDLESKSQALTNLAMSYQHSKDYEKAHELFTQNHNLLANSAQNNNNNSTRSQLHLLALSHSYLACISQLIGNQTGSQSLIAEAREHYEKSLEIFNTLEACEEQRKSIQLNLDTLTHLMAQISAGEQIELAESSQTTCTISSTQPTETTTQSNVTQPAAPSANNECENVNLNVNAPASSGSKANSTRTSTSVSNNTSASNSKSNSTNDINHNNINSS